MNARTQRCACGYQNNMLSNYRVYVLVGLVELSAWRKWSVGWANCWVSIDSVFIWNGESIQLGEEE